MKDPLAICRIWQKMGKFWKYPGKKWHTFVWSEYEKLLQNSSFQTWSCMFYEYRSRLHTFVSLFFFKALIASYNRSERGERERNAAIKKAIAYSRSETSRSLSWLVRPRVERMEFSPQKTTGANLDLCLGLQTRAIFSTGIPSSCRKTLYLAK